MTSVAVKNLNKSIVKVIEEVQNSTLDKVLNFVKEHVKDEESFISAFEEFKKTIKQENSVILDTNKKGASVSEDKKKRVPSEYNIFIGEKIKELKKTNPDKGGKLLMQEAIVAWKEKKNIK